MRTTFNTLEQAINYAQSVYEYDHRYDATAEGIARAEDWINAQARSDDVIDAVTKGRLHVSPSTGRIYVQLKRRG